MGGNFTLCSDTGEARKRAAYFARPEAFHEPDLFDSDQSSYDLDNMSFVSDERLQKKWDKQQKLSPSSGDFEGSVSSQYTLLTPPNRVRTKKRKRELHSRVRTKPIKLQVWDTDVQPFRVNVGSYSLKGRKSLSSCESTSTAEVKNSIKSILEPFVSEKTENKLDKNIDEMLTELISNFQSFEKDESAVLKTRSQKMREPVDKQLERCQANFNRTPLSPNHNFLSVSEDQSVKPLDTPDNFEEKLTKRQDDIKNCPQMSEILSLQEKISELTSDINRLKLRSVDNFCNKNTKMERERNLLENQLRNIKKQLSTKLLDIQVNLMSGFNMDYLEKLGITKSPSHLPVSTTIKNRRRSKSFDMKSTKGLKTELSASNSSPQAAINHTCSCQSQSPKSLNWDYSSRRFPKIVRSHLDKCLLKIDENRYFT